MIKNQTSLSPDEEYVSHDVDSLFTNISGQVTINYIIYQICNEKNVSKICSKTIFKRLMYKLSTQCVFQFNQTLFKKIGGSSMGGPWSVTLRVLDMIKTEKHMGTPLKPIFYKKFVDDIYNRRKKDIHDNLSERLNNYHRNIKLAIEINPNKFLDTEIIENEGAIETKITGKQQSYQFVRLQVFLKGIRGIL